MKPHPLFTGHTIPTVQELGPFILRILTVEDVDRDYSAVMESVAEIRAQRPDTTWPDGLTHHDNLLDLAWHQREFESRRSFTFVIEDPTGNYLGCLYIYPALTGETAADVTWWWRTGQQADRAALRPLLETWFASPPWPRLTYRLQAG